MTSVEKRRSGRKSGGHRKHSDGGHSDASSGGSFLDENDREVSNLTDRAFRSLCIGDEAVYNDSDLCLSSPCTQRDRQLAFNQSGQDRDREREELKRAAHENFSLRVQQYGQDWIHGGMYGAEIHRDPQWEVYGERTQGRVSATFQQSFVETSQQEKSLREEQLSFFSNGATELNSQQCRSRSRVSSLIRAFNSEGHRDGAGMDEKLREWNDETSWDKSALMSIQRELSEFSTSYQQNFNTGHFPPAGSFSSRDTNFYSSELAAVAHMSHNSASSFMRSSHSKHSMTAQVNCNSNFFIHSEYSPFKVWKDHNRFPFQHGEISGFMHCSEFPKWYETPMYKELSLEDQPHGAYRGIRHPRSNLAPVVPTPNPPRSTSTSTQLQKASSVEKRCESELTGHYPHRKRTQSLGTNRLPSQRPSTASPTIEMSRRVRDTISSVKALQQKIKMMTEQNIATEVIANQQGVLYSNDNLIPFGSNAATVAPNVVGSTTSATPFNISQQLTPFVHPHQEAETSDFQHYAVSPQPVEHPPVRAESRGGTPDVRMSSYKSRATSLLFNLKDNRKRVKSTYSPTKFRGLEMPEKNKQPSIQEPQETVIDIPDFPDPELQFPQLEEYSRTNAVAHQNVNQYHNPGLSLPILNSQPAITHTGQYPEYTLNDYQTAQMQGQMVHHPGFTGFIHENYTSNQLANGQHLHDNLVSFAPYNQGVIDNVGTLGGDVHRLKQSYTATEPHRLNADNNQSREYLISKANIEQPFNETVGRVFTKVERYEQLKDSKHDYNNVSLQDKWRQTNSQDTEMLNLKAALSPWKQETAALMEKTRQENQPSINKELEKVELRESFSVETSSHKKGGLVSNNISNQLPQCSLSNDSLAYYDQQQHLAFKVKHAFQKNSAHNEEGETKVNYNRLIDQEYRSQHAFYSTKEKPMAMQETSQRKQYTPIPKGHEIQQPIEAKPPSEHNMQKTSLSNPDNTSAVTMANQTKDKQFIGVKADQVTAEHIKVQHTQAELAKAQQWAQVEQPKAESSRLILAGQTDSEKVKTEQAKSEVTKQENVKQAQPEHIKEEKRKGEQTEQSNERQLEWAREEQTKTEKTREQKVADEPRNITEEAVHMSEEQGKQIKTEQAEAERLKEEHIKTKLAKTEETAQARIKQTKTEHATGKRVPAEPVEEEHMSTEQVKREQMETEQIETETVNAEQAEAESRKVGEINTEQKERQTKAEQVTKVAEVGKVKTHHIKVEDIVQVGPVNAEQPTIQISMAEETKPGGMNVEQTKLEQTKTERAKAELPKTENMQERSAKLTAKLTATQQVKSEPDKVEQVKTELAKAKAELAKIKEKMRGEQKDKVRNTLIMKEDDIAKNNVPSGMNLIKSEDHKKEDQAAQRHQQKEDLVVKNSSGQTVRGADDYDRLREKYGFINAVSTNRNKLATTGHVPSNDTNETEVLSLDIVETVDKGDRSLTANTECKEEAGSLISSELTESQYVYSESSKEFKLSRVNYFPSNVDKRANGDTVTDKAKNDSVEKLEKGDPVKDSDVSQQRYSDVAKPLILERKPKATEHNVGPGKDSHPTPPRALSHKERAQTKQEILTSKIKAHAEKEISAIKEKGFAIRDGFISKSSTKQLASGQSVNIRQRPPSQEVSKKLESTVSSSITPNHQMEASGAETVTSATPVNSAATTTQLVDHLQNVVLEPPRKTKQTGSHIMSTAEGLVQNQKQGDQPGIKSPMQTNEQAPKIGQGKQQTNHEETSEEQKEGRKDNPVINSDILIKKKDDSSQATGVEAASSKSVTTEKAASKEAAHEDSEPSLSLVLGQKVSPVAADSLQIMGIMVTVRERKPSVNIVQGNQEQISATEKECRNSELDKYHLNSSQEVRRVNTSSKENSVVKEKDIQETEEQIKVGMKSHPENVQQTSTLQRRNVFSVTENVTEKKTNLQQESSTINAKPQREILPLAEKDVPFTDTVPAKNKVLSETQPLLYSQDIIARETQDYTDKTPKENSAKGLRADEIKSNTEEKNTLKMQTVHHTENLNAKVVTTGINKNGAETLVKRSINSNVDGKNAPLLEENRHDTASPKTFNKASPSNNLTENENKSASPKHKYKDIHTGGNSQEDDNVHIGSIAIKVVPAVTEKHDGKMVEKHHTTTSDVDEHKQVASSSGEGKANTLNTEDRTKVLTPASSEKKTKDSLEDKLGVQYMSSVRKMSDSLKVSTQQKSISATSENPQAQNVKPENIMKSEKLVDESNIQPVVGGYFQVQGVTETCNEPHNNTTTAGDTPKGGELPGLPNKIAISNESYKEEKNEAFMFSVDQGERKTVDSSSVSIQNENMKRENWETDDKLASKQTDGSSERWSNNEKMEAGHTNHIRKHHKENQSSLSARERQRSRQSTRESTDKDKPEVKPKPKERVSTIPEISAIADYARLKVIVSEDTEADTVQEFPPNKKEGFFPLIQTRHSRRPVFTADPQELSVKDKGLPSKTEMSAKVNKEPKSLVFPITEKEHQRTGMFKLGDKERQEKMLLDSKVNEGVLDSTTKHAHYKERNKSPTSQTDHVAGAATQRVSQVDQSICQTNNPSLQTTMSAVNKPRNTSEGLTNLDKNSLPHLTLGQKHKRKENMAHLRKDERTEKQQDKDTKAKTENAWTDQLNKERLATQHEETKAKQQGRVKQLEEERASRSKDEKREEDMIKKPILDERRASLTEEEKRVLQKEEERRAREHETIAIKIKERQEKQREAERRAEEERKAKQREEEIKEEMRAKQREKEIRIKETEEKRRIRIEKEGEAKLRMEEEQKKEHDERRRVKMQEEEKAIQEEQQRRAAHEEHKRSAQEAQRRAAQEEQQKRAAQEEQKRAAQEEQQKRAAQEQQRRAAQEEQQRRAAQEEQQRRAAQEEQKRAAQEEQHRRAAQEEQRRAAQEQQQRRAAREEQQRRAAQEEQQRRAAQEEQKRAAQEEQHRRAAQEEQQRRAAREEQQRRAAQEEQRRAAQEEQQRRAAQEEQQRRVAQEEQKRVAQEEQRRAVQEEQKRRAAQEEQQRRAAEEQQQRRAAQEEQQRKAAQEEQQRRAVQEEQKRVAQEEQRRAAQEEQKRVAQEEQRRAAQEEQQRRVAQEEQKRVAQEEQRRAVQEEQQRRAAQEEQQRRAAEEERQRRAAQEEQQRKAAQEEQQRKAAQEEQQRRAVQEEQQRRAAQEEQKRIAVQEEQKRVAQEEQRRAAQEEQKRVAQEEQRRAAQEEQRRAVQKEQQRRTAQEEQQRRAALEEQQRRAAQEEQQRKAAQEEQQRRAAQEDQQRRAAQEEQKRAAHEEQSRAAQEEQQRRAAQEEQQRKAAQEEQKRATQEEQQRRAAQEEQQRRAAQEEQQRRAVQEEQRRAAQVEQQRRAVQEEQRRAAQEEQQRRAAQEEKQKRAAQEEQQRRAAKEEQQRRAAQEEKQKRAAQEEQQRRAAKEEQQRRAAQEEQQRRAAQEEQQRRAAQEEQQRGAAQEEQRRAALIEEQRQAKQAEVKILADIEVEKKRKQAEEEKVVHILEDERIKLIQEQKKAEQKIEEQRRERQNKEEWMRREEEERNRKQTEEKQAKEEKVRLLEERVAQEQILAQRQNEIQLKKREEEKLAAHREKVRAAQMEKQRRAAQMDVLQYYAITSTESERKLGERQQSSPLPSQQRNNPPGLESADDSTSHTKPYRPHAPASPAPSLPRSNTSSPALGAKPLMFRVKDNTLRGSSFTKSVKPRFHKNFGEDFWAGSLVDKGSERREEEQEIMRRSAGTPIHPDTGINRLAAISESSTFQSASASQEYSAPVAYHRPYSRRSIVMDEDDSRSVFSNMSEDVESYATTAADLADVRGLYDYERPESACSFSSDVSRSLGKPPAVPPKSDKALRRAQRLTTRRIKKELSKAAAVNPAGAEKEVSGIPSSSSTEVRSSNHYAVASPHFSSPVSLAHAPMLGSSLPSFHTEHHSSQCSFHASPHATGPISLPVSSPHANAAVSLPAVSAHATGPASQPAAPKAVTDVPSSPILHQANLPAPVTQYHVESSYSQSYPLTQRKVLQDLGSGQYFVVDVPVQVKTKTFFDPETGKYVQLNVRESGQSISRPQPQQIQIKAQQQPLSQTSPAGKPVVFYQGYHGYPQPAVIKSVQPPRSSAPATLHQDQQSASESHSYGCPPPETGQNSEGHRYSPEKTPYMDTVNDIDKAHNTVYSTHGSYESFPESDTNSQLAGSSVCENDNSAHSRCQPRDIITMSELEDFMEVSDW